MTDDKPRLVVRYTFSDRPDTPYEIDLYDLRLAEQVAIEEYFEKPMTQLQVEGWLTGSAKGKAFIGYLARKREEPGFTLAESIEFDADAEARTEEDEAARPTETPNPSGSPSSETSSE